MQCFLLKKKKRVYACSCHAGWCCSLYYSLLDLICFVHMCICHHLLLKFSAPLDKLLCDGSEMITAIILYTNAYCIHTIHSWLHRLRLLGILTTGSRQGFLRCANDCIIYSTRALEHEQHEAAIRVANQWMNTVTVLCLQTVCVPMQLRQASDIMHRLETRCKL